MALVLMKRALDVWKPGHHTGTFRGQQLSFVAATAALNLWRGSVIVPDIERRGSLIERQLKQTAAYHPGIDVRGIGMIWGLDVARAGGPTVAAAIARLCFERGLLIERCGRDDTVLKLLPPLTIEDAVLERGLAIIREAVRDTLAIRRPADACLIGASV